MRSLLFAILVLIYKIFLYTKRKLYIYQVYCRIELRVYTRKWVIFRIKTIIMIKISIDILAIIIYSINITSGRFIL